MQSGWIEGGGRRRQEHVRQMAEPGQGEWRVEVGREGVWKMAVLLAATVGAWRRVSGTESTVQIPALALASSWCF